MSDKMTFEQAMDRLAKFQTADGIARFLKREGITMPKEAGVNGVVSRAYRCPLAMWLKKVLGEEPTSTKVTVGSEGVYVGMDYRRLPGAALAFVRRFDAQKNLYKFLRD